MHTVLNNIRMFVNVSVTKVEHEKADLFRISSNNVNKHGRFSFGGRRNKNVPFLYAST